MLEVWRPALRGEAEGPGLVQPRDDTSSGEPKSSLSVSMSHQSSSQWCVIRWQQIVGVNWNKKRSNQVWRWIFPHQDSKWWNRLLSEVLQAPSLEVFKTLMDKAPSNFVIIAKGLWAEGWTTDLLMCLPTRTIMCFLDKTGKGGFIT